MNRYYPPAAMMAVDINVGPAFQRLGEARAAGRRPDPKDVDYVADVARRANVNPEQQPAAPAPAAAAPVRAAAPTALPRFPASGVLPTQPAQIAPRRVLPTSQTSQNAQAVHQNQLANQSRRQAQAVAAPAVSAPLPAAPANTDPNAR